MSFGSVWSDDEIFEFEKACALEDYSYRKKLINKALSIGVEDHHGKISECDLYGYSEESLERMIEGRERDLVVINAKNRIVVQKNLKQVLHSLR